MPVIDITGKQFGRWKVLRRVENNSRGDACWECQCQCDDHTIAVVLGKNLRSGHSQSCGCLKKEKAKEQGKKNSLDLTGQKFGQLTVIEKAYSKNYKVFWKCRCDCGNETFVPGDKLKSGHTTSCGCKVIENIEGKKFGHLTVIRKSEQRTPDGSIIWECQCDCGSNEKIYKSKKQLTNSLNLSCGCESKRSQGEEKIIQLLKDNHIQFEQQKSFDNCVFPDSNKKAFFDFFVENKYLIEFDGEQHFIARENGWNNKEHLKRTQFRDAIKNNWCKDNSISLIRIPYNHLNELKIEDLLLETSNFIVK